MAEDLRYQFKQVILLGYPITYDIVYIRELIAAPLGLITAQIEYINIIRYLYGFPYILINKQDAKVLFLF